MSDARTLVLTSWMAPHRIVEWTEGICLLVTEKVDVLESYEETVSSPSVTLPIPAVVRLRKATATMKKKVKFSRANVMTRDNWRCQYCGERKEAHKLNYDHVVPRIQGGKTVWTNIVASCYTCNDKKKGRTPEQAGMRLLRYPVKPPTLPMTGPFIHRDHEVPAQWKFYLGDEMSSLAG